MAKTLLERLRPWRDQIDSIDQQILQLLNQRAQAALEIGKLKEEYNANDSILKPEREAQIVTHLQNINGGPITDDSVKAVWSEVISACRGLERQMRVAFLGPQGSFSEQAALNHFGHFVETVPCASFDEVFRVVEVGEADVGMVPVENSTEGAVNRTLDLLLSSPLKVLGESSLAIHHCLMTQSGSMDGVTRIMAHPQALAQCQHWLSRHYPQITQDAASSNAEAARLAAQDSTIAAIAGQHAADYWQLAVVQANIQDDTQNRTRFLAVGNIEPLPSGKDKTSLILAVPNRIGVVHEMLAPFAEHQVSMTRLESRPARTGQWEYYFYLDLLGHKDDVAVRSALEELKQQVAFLKILGSYPHQA